MLDLTSICDFTTRSREADVMVDTNFINGGLTIWSLPWIVRRLGKSPEPAPARFVSFFVLVRVISLITLNCEIYAIHEITRTNTKICCGLTRQH